jgi:hypothetical protein
MGENPYQPPPCLTEPPNKPPRSPFRVVLASLLIVMSAMAGVLAGSTIFNAMEWSSKSDVEAWAYVAAANGGGFVAGAALAYPLVRGMFRRGD